MWLKNSRDPLACQASGLVKESNQMSTIDITKILSPDLKSRISARNLDLFIRNSGEESVVLDFTNVKFATRGFMDEFYNLFIADADLLPYHLEIINIPKDINRMMEIVSSAQRRSNRKSEKANFISFSSVDEMKDYLKTLSI